MAFGEIVKFRLPQVRTFNPFPPLGVLSTIELSLIDKVSKTQHKLKKTIQKRPGNDLDEYRSTIFRTLAIKIFFQKILSQNSFVSQTIKNIILIVVKRFLKNYWILFSKGAIGHICFQPLNSFLHLGVGAIFLYQVSFHDYKYKLYCITHSRSLLRGQLELHVAQALDD